MPILYKTKGARLRFNSSDWGPVPNYSVISPNVNIPAVTDVDDFGFAIDLKNYIIAITCHAKNATKKNRVYIYKSTDEGMTWLPMDIIQDPTGGIDAGHFGYTVNIQDDNSIVVGHARVDEVTFQYVYKEYLYTTVDDINWVYDSVSDGLSFPPNSIDENSYFKATGSPYSNPGFTGAMLTYNKDSNGDWQLQQTVVQPDPENDDRFGTALSLYGNQILVSAPSFSSNSFPAGRVYIFQTNDYGLTWDFVRKLNTGAKSYHHYGARVALWKNVAVVNQDSWGYGDVHIYTASI